MKTNKLLTLALAASALAFAACDDDDDNNKGVADGSTLSGAISESVTLTAGNTYRLSGEYIVKAGATLNIEQGVTIVAIDDDIVDYILVEQGGDDGFEFFGGTVNISHAVATSRSDDSFDWTEGWSGRAQFIVAYQQPESTLGYDCDCLMECDNNGKDFGAKPVAHPIIANATLVGNGSSVGKRGVRLRAGTEVELYNTIIVGKANPLTVETTETETAMLNGISKLSHVVISSELTSKEGIYTNADFVAATGNAINANPGLTSNVIGTLEGSTSLTDPFFATADYTGAVPASANWMTGWTR